MSEKRCRFCGLYAEPSPYKRNWCMFCAERYDRLWYAYRAAGVPFTAQKMRRAQRKWKLVKP